MKKGTACSGRKKEVCLLIKLFYIPLARRTQSCADTGAVGLLKVSEFCCGGAMGKGLGAEGLAQAGAEVEHLRKRCLFPPWYLLGEWSLPSG